jgi:hypothetical protein
VYTQAAYNNTSEIELEESDVTSLVEPVMSLFPIGTKVAKQFEGDDQQLEWFEGAIERIDEDDKLYWVLYTDGDSEDMVKQRFETLCVIIECTCSRTRSLLALLTRLLVALRQALAWTFIWLTQHCWP